MVGAKRAVVDQAALDLAALVLALPAKKWPEDPTKEGIPHGTVEWWLAMADRWTRFWWSEMELWKKGPDHPSLSSGGGLGHASGVLHVIAKEWLGAPHALPMNRLALEVAEPWNLPRERLRDLLREAALVVRDIELEVAKRRSKAPTKQKPAKEPDREPHVITRAVIWAARDGKPGSIATGKPLAQKVMTAAKNSRVVNPAGKDLSWLRRHIGEAISLGYVERIATTQQIKLTGKPIPESWTPPPGSWKVAARQRGSVRKP